MRLFLALGLALIVGVGASFGSGNNVPGREVGAAESGRVVGGAQACASAPCNFCGTGSCYSSGSGSACERNCIVAASCNGS